MKIYFKLSIAALLIAFFIASCNNKKPSKTITEFGEINVVIPSEFEEKSKNQLIVDIRTPQEFAQGHIEGAININLFDKNFTEQFSEFNKSEPIFLYCKSGMRSSKATEKLEALGFQNIYDLQGGIINWTKNNKPIIK